MVQLIPTVQRVRLSFAIPVTNARIIIIVYLFSTGSSSPSQYVTRHGVKNTVKSDAVIPVTNVSGVLGRNARLPCDTTPPSEDNPLLIVIWFKESSPDPIYR